MVRIFIQLLAIDIHGIYENLNLKNIQVILTKNVNEFQIAID